MATVKILYDSEASHLEEYLKRNQDKEMLTTEQSCSLDGVAKEFASLQRDHSSKGNNSIHLIQSWSPKESKTLTKEQVHEMGVELATRFAPGHQFIVQTHDDRAHSHNHIMINPVNLETGKRIQNKLENIRTVRNINDDIARERRLELLPPQEKLTRPGLNERANRIEAYRGRSYILDLGRKARFASAHATNYDEYLSILGAFDIKARIEQENITYYYPGRTHGKRGRNLDPALDKPCLEKKFAGNLEKVEQNSKLRQGLSDIVKTAYHRELQPRSGMIAIAPVSHRREEHYTEPRADMLKQSPIPIEAFQAAKGKNILDYCKREKVALNVLADGRTVLKDREQLEVTSHSWINHKNKTRGNVIDFVSNHRKVSLLQSVSMLTDNPRLMLLEQYAGQEQSNYRSFFIPEQDKASRPNSILAITRMLGRETPRDKFSDLFKQQRIQVNSVGAIRFFSERNGSQYTEYIPDAAGRYKQNYTGANGVFLSRIKSASEIELYSSPKSLLIHRPDAFANKPEKQNGVLALLEPNLEAVHRAVAAQPQLSRISLIEEPGTESNPDVLKFFDDLKQSLNPFSIDITLAWEPSFRSQASREAVRGAGLGLSREMSFTQGGR